jgi:hypothetical protein
VDTSNPLVNGRTLGAMVVTVGFVKLDPVVRTAFAEASAA